MSTLRSKVIHLAHDQPEFRQYLLPILKEAGILFRKEKVTIPTNTGEPREIDALVLGPWSIYKNIRGSGYAVTFTQTGQAITTKPPTLMDAKAFLETIIQLEPALAHVNDVGDIMRYKTVIEDVLRNPPMASGTSKKPPVEKVSEKREKLKRELETMGLVPWGRRSGKSGEFYAPRMLGRMGESPTISISLGNRDVLLNHYDLDAGQWRMWDAELISTMTPEKLKKWVGEVKIAPTRGAVRRRSEEYGDPDEKYGDPDSY